MHTTGWKGVDTIASLWLTIMMVASLMLPPSVQAQEKETITWVVVDYPPVHILDGAKAGTGTLDVLIEFMQQELPQYHHTIEVFPNFTRLVAEVEDPNLHVCAPSYLYYPPGHGRRKRAAISATNVLMPLQDIVIRNEDRSLYGNEVSFADLLQNQQLIWGHPAGASYYPTLRKVVSDYVGSKDDLWSLPPEQRATFFEQTPNIYRRSGSDMMTGLLKMLAEKRIDYLLMYSSVMRYYADEMGWSDQFTTIPVTEIRDNYGQQFAFACANSEWGHQVIRDINSVLIKQRNTPEYRQLMSWFIPNDPERKAAYWKAYQELVVNVSE